ncbi:MAG: efflux RND transporter periplasmic adaptor subunit [Bryobacteraceae bacterium]
MPEELASNKLLETGPEPKLLDAPRPASKRAPWLIGLGLLLLVGLLFLAGYLPRRNRGEKIDAEAQQEEENLPIVNVTKVKRSVPVSELILPGNITPLTEAYIYARASGYVKRRFVDIGDRVRAGQLLAEIDSPELAQQVQQARAGLGQSRAQLGQTQAALGQARSQLKLAAVTLERWNVLVGRGVLSKQEGDQKQADYENAEANVRAAEADVKAAQDNVGASEANLNRLIEMQGFTNVRAPFAGVITARNIDTGALISASGAGQGNSAGGTAASSANGSQNSEMFRIAQIGTLRIMVNVPQSNAPAIHLGQQADIMLQEYSRRKFAGHVTRTASSLDQNSRTMLTEVQVANPDRLLLPGMYSQVRFTSTRENPPLLIPGDSLVTRGSGPQVAILLPGNKVHYQSVDIGRDYGTDIEVSSGLQGTEYVIVNPSDDAKEGATVRPAKAILPPGAKAAPPAKNSRPKK